MKETHLAEPESDCTVQGLLLLIEGFPSLMQAFVHPSGVAKSLDLLPYTFLLPVAPVAQRYLVTL